MKQLIPDLLRARWVRAIRINRRVVEASHTDTFVAVYASSFIPLKRRKCQHYKSISGVRGVGAVEILVGRSVGP